MNVGSQLKRLSKDTLFYGLGSSINRFIGFLMFPIFTRALSREDYGNQDLVLTAVTIATTVIALGLDVASSRYYYDTDNHQEKYEILSTWLWFELIISIPASLLLILFASPICGWLFSDPSLAVYFRLGVAAIPLILVSRITMMALRLTFQPKKYSLVSAIGLLAYALIAMYLVVVLNMGLTGVFLSTLITSFLRMILGLSFTYKFFRFSFSPSWLKPLLAFGVPLVPASLSMWVLNYANRYFLIHSGTATDVGMMSVATKIAQIVTFIIASFQIAWGPFAFSLLKEDRIAKETYSKALTYFLILIMPLAVGVSVFAKEIIIILASLKYVGSAIAVPFLILSAVIWGAIYIIGMGYKIAKKTYHTTVRVIMAASLTVIVNLLLIPRWGILGAAIATFIGNLVALAYTYLVSQHYYKINYETRKLLILILLTIAAIALGIWVDNTTVGWSFGVQIIKALILISYEGCLLLFKIIEIDQIRMVFNWGIENLRSLRFLRAKHDSKPL